VSIEHDVEQITQREARGSAALWFAVLGSPVAWLGSLGLNYPLEEVLACAPATSDRGEILGVSADGVSWTLNSLMALLAAAAGLTAVVCWQRLRRASDGDVLERSQWMAYAGMVEGAIFFAAIVLAYIPPLLLDTCTTSP
jgi:hypothetical protein